MASYWTNKGLKDLANLAVPSQTLKIMLVNAAPANAATAADYNFVADVVAHEIAATGYVRKTLSTIAINEDDTDDWAAFDADDPSTWTALGGASNDTIVGAWIFRSVSTDADHVLWVYLGLGSSLTTNGGDVTIGFNAAGIAKLVSA